METQQWNPLPAIGKFTAKAAVRAAVSRAVLAVLLVLAVAATRATHGWIHLVLGLVVVSTFMAIAQSAGALLAARRKQALVPLAFTAKYWLLLPMLMLWPMLSLAGISDDDKQPMLLGVLVGIIAVYALWSCWGLLVRRRPAFKYHPARLKGWQWYLRISTNIGGLIGGFAGIGIVNM
ncbi:hypothetical protein [Streptomyces griseorubiginosus]|uniref:hypothetical protein n=1 Tax=Streptomyces griseorubiginosus TaxID=67304 RepID=UPI00332ED4F8